MTNLRLFFWCYICGFGRDLVGLSLVVAATPPVGCHFCVGGSLVLQHELRWSIACTSIFGAIFVVHSVFVDILWTETIIYMLLRSYSTQASKKYKHKRRAPNASLAILFDFPSRSRRQHWLGVSSAGCFVVPMIGIMAGWRGHSNNSSTTTPNTPSKDAREARRIRGEGEAGSSVLSFFCSPCLSERPLTTHTSSALCRGNY